MTQLHYEIHAGSGPPVLLVHGFLSSPAQWQDNIDAIADVATPVTVALYGHGGSPSPDDPAFYTPQHYVEEFELIRRALGVEQWLLCGYSFGAGLTFRYVLEHPEHVIGHIMTNSMSGFAEPAAPGAAPGAIVQRFEEGGLAAIEQIAIHPKHARRLPAGVRQAILEDAKKLDPGGIGRCIAYTLPTLSVRDDVSRNPRPALLVCGTREARFQPYRDFLENSMPRLRIVDIPVGHAVNAQEPGHFNDAITDFIRDCA